MRIYIIGAGDSGATAANQVRRLDRQAQIDVFSKRSMLGCPPCEMPLILGGEIANWDELIRGFRQDSFWEKRNIKLHLGTEVSNVVSEGNYIIAGGKQYEDTFIMRVRDTEKGVMTAVDPMGAILEKRGIVNITKIGQSTVKLFRAQDAYRITAEEMKRNPRLLYRIE